MPLDTGTDILIALMGLKWRNAGQACVTANRVYVQSGVYNKFADIVTEQTSKLVLGHGNSKSSTLGPVTTPQTLDRARDQVEDAKAHGASVLIGGARLANRPGFFFQPTIIADATSKMRIAHEETFAPILSLFRFETEEEVVKAANDTPVSDHDLICFRLSLISDPELVGVSFVRIHK